MSQPILTTQRLHLRPFTLEDAPHVQMLAGERAVASTTGALPHPYEAGMAEQWIATHQPTFERGGGATFAIIRSDTRTLMGAISLVIHASHQNAEIGYWLGVPFWNQGYGTEAARAILQYGFQDCQLHRIFSSHLTRNPASGRIMQKIGMTYEGCFRQHFYKWGVFEDIAYYGILRTEWETHQVAETRV